MSGRTPGPLLAVMLAAGFACSAAAQPILYGEARLRSDDIEDLPGGREFERIRLFGVLGYTGDLATGGAWGAALRFAAGTDANDDNVRNLDNEESDELDLGELWLRLPVGTGGQLTLGQAPLPLFLTPMTWDADLRSAGLGYEYVRPLGDYDELIVQAGYWAPHHIDEYQIRLTALQASWRFREGAPQGGSVTLSYLDFSDTDRLVADRRSRSNRVQDGRLVSDYELLNLTLQYRFPVRGRVLLASLDLAHNLGADADGDAVRAALLSGDAWNGGHWEFGYAYQRIQRDALLAAFNSDDWWFPTWMRGWSPWVAYGIRDNLRLRLAGFVERRDDRQEHSKRLLMDLHWLF